MQSSKYRKQLLRELKGEIIKAMVVIRDIKDG